MSNLTFSRKEGLSDLTNHEEAQDLSKRRHPFDLQKYQHILDQISTAHQFDADFENRLNQLTDQSRPTDKSSYLNKQYAKYISQDVDLSQVKMIDPSDPAEDILTHEEAKELISEMKTRPIKFQYFFKILSQLYSLEFDDKRKKEIFKENLKERLVTVDKDTVSLNALQLYTRNRGVTGLIEEIVEEVVQDCQKQQKLQINNEIVDELENVKLLLEKRQQLQNKREKELIEYEYQLQRFKSEMSNSIQQVYEILSKMMEESYQQKISTLMKKFNNLEHQLKSKLKLIELKGQSVQKNNLQYSQEIQRLKQKNTVLEKQTESYKIRISELEKKLTLEKDNTIQAQKKLEKMHQKLQEQKEQHIQQIVATDQSEMIFQTNQPNKDIIKDQKEPSIQKKSPTQEIVQKQSNESNSKQIKYFQSLIEQIFVGFEYLQNQFQIESNKWYQEILPDCLQDNLIDLISNMMSIVINKQGINSIYKLLLQLSYFYFKNTNCSISQQSVEEQMKNPKKQCKYFIGLHDSKNREFVQQLRTLIEKKKKNQTIISLILMMYDRDTSFAIKYLIQEIHTEETQKLILEQGLLWLLIIKTLDDKSVVNLLLEIIAQGQYQSQFLMQMSTYFDILLSMLWNPDNEFCEQLSIILQRVQYYNHKEISQQHQQLLQKKLNCDQNVSNIAYGQGQLSNTLREPIITIQKTFDSFVKYEQARSDAQMRTSIIDPTICRLNKFTTSEQKSFCGQFFGIQLHYQYTEKCLENIKKFSEHDLLNIIRDVTHALLIFISKRIRHGYLSPQTILVTNNNRYLLTDIRFITDMYEYKMQLIGFTSTCYLAPHLIYELGKRTLNPIYNYEKSEVFSLGVIILELAIQQSIQSIYNLNKYSVSQDIIDTYLRMLPQKYSNYFIDLLSRMLKINEEQRIDLYDLEKLLTQVEKTSQINIDKYINQHTMQNRYGVQHTDFSSNQRFQTPKRVFSNYTTHFESQSPNTMTFVKPKPQILEGPTSVESYKLSPRRIKTEQSEIYNTLHQHSESFISPTRKQDNNLDDLFLQFDNNLQKVKQKIHHLRINTPTSQTQSINNPSLINQSYVSIDEFPTFKPTQIPKMIDVSMNQFDYSSLYQKDFSALDKPNYLKDSYYNDMQGEAVLPISGTIHMHSSGPTTLSDFFLKRK